MDRKLEELINRELLKNFNMSGLTDLLKKKEEPKKTNPFVIALAVVGAIASVAAIAFAVYYFFFPVYEDEFEDDYDDYDDDEE